MSNGNRQYAIEDKTLIVGSLVNVIRGGLFCLSNENISYSQLNVMVTTFLPSNSCKGVSLVQITFLEDFLFRLTFTPKLTSWN
jgi:hypothetical protein